MNRFLILLLSGVIKSTTCNCMQIIDPIDFDSLKIAFVSYQTDKSEIYIMNSNGSGIQQLTESEENNSFPFQIDARTLGFVRELSDGSQQKMKIDIYTKEENRLDGYPIRQGAKWEATSPSNEYVAFIRSTDYRDRELFIYNKNLEKEFQVTSLQEVDHAAYSINHCWSADSKYLAFMSGPDWFNQFIRIYDVKQNVLRTVTARGYMNSGLQWLANGRTLIANLKIRNETSYEIYSIDIATGDLQQLTYGINLHPDISKDGEWIVFESQRDSNEGNIYIMRKDGTNQIRLTNTPYFMGRCVWFEPR